jgi:hypothetical protein
VWTSDSSLEISSIKSPLLFEVGSLLTLKSGVLKAQCTSKVDPACSSWESNASQNSTILAPLSAITPAVTVSIATQIGPCDDLFLDMTSSSGAGGRLWKSVSFVVFGSNPNITKLQHFLSTSINPSLVRAPFTIPSRLLSPGYGYSLEVKLCNFLNSCGSIIKSFVVSFSSEVPMVFLNSPNKITILRNTTLSISGDAYISTCEQTKSRSSLLFSWSTNNQIIQTSEDLISISIQNSQRVLAYCLS